MSQNGLFLGAGSDCSPSPCPSGDFLGVYHYETTSTYCDTDIVTSHFEDDLTICEVGDEIDPDDDPDDPDDTVSCKYEIVDGQFVQTCVYEDTDDGCTTRTVIVSRFRFDTNGYTATGRARIEMSGEGQFCIPFSSCTDFSFTATRTAPPPDPCESSSLAEQQEAMARVADRIVRSTLR